MNNLYDVITANKAKRELRNAANYIMQDLGNEPAALRLISKFYETGELLERNPLIRPLVRDEVLAEKGVRSLPVNNYSLFYVVRENIKQVNVIRFMYSRRDWAKYFSDSDFEV
jgi:toxin ParE1/3/4